MNAIHNCLQGNLNHDSNGMLTLEAKICDTIVIVGFLEVINAFKTF